MSDFLAHGPLQAIVKHCLCDHLHTSHIKVQNLHAMCAIIPILTVISYLLLFDICPVAVFPKGIKQ